MLIRIAEHVSAVTQIRNAIFSIKNFCGRMPWGMRAYYIQDVKKSINKIKRNEDNL